MTRSLAFAVCAIATLSAELYVLAFYAPARVVSDGRHLTPIEEFTSGVPVRQVFATYVDGLDRIDVLMRAARPSGAEVAWTLQRVEGGAVVQTAASGRQRFSLPEGDSWQVFPISTPSALPPGRYALSLTLDPASVSPEARVAVVNVLDNPLRDGYVAVSGVPRWGDLGMRTRARDETAAARFLRKVVPGLRAPFDRAVVWFGVLLALNALAAVTVREMLRS